MTTEYKYNTLDEVVIELHALARIIEREIGEGSLSQDIRNCADRVNATIKKEIYAIRGLPLGSKS